MERRLVSVPVYATSALQVVPEALVLRRAASIRLCGWVMHFRMGSPEVGTAAPPADGYSGLGAGGQCGLHDHFCV